MKIKDIAISIAKYAVVAAVAVAAALLYKGRNAPQGGSLAEEVEYTDSLGNYNKIFYDKEFSSLRKENEGLYDSLKKQRDKIDYLLQFDYEKTYSSGIVEIRHDTTYVEKALEPITYEYANEKNDTFQYSLKINSDVEPNWYSLDVKAKDKFTIINKKVDGSDLNQLSIGTDGGGAISNVTAFNKKQKRTFKERIAIGPSVSVGYDPFNKKVGMVVGIGMTYDLFGK